jgi:hypothetical protein
MNIRLIILLIGFLISCTDDKRIFETPPTDPDNGGLILPQGFGALVVADSVGPARQTSSKVLEITQMMDDLQQK